MTKNLRFATIDDAQHILNIYRPIVEQSPASFETDVPTLQEIEYRIETKQPWLICEIDNQIAGYVYASPHRSRLAYQWSIDVSAYVHSDYRQRKIGKALYTCLFALLKQQNYVNAYAGIALPNPASVRLHESMGFQPIGVYQKVGYKLGQWHDVGWWHLLLCVPPNPPQEPIQQLPCETIEKILQDGLAIIR